MVLLSRRILRGYLLFMHFTNYLLSMLFPSGGFFSNIKNAFYFSKMKCKQKIHDNSEVMFSYQEKVSVLF